jgi:excisionase family DNA binding protein
MDHDKRRVRVADADKAKRFLELKRLLNVKEGAEVLNVSEHTLRQWIHQRRVPVVKLGKAVRFDPEDLQKFIEENRREAVTF